MIDEKKIEEAKKAFIADKKVLGIVAVNDLACGFKAGAHWAIEQFLKDLWHDARKYKPTDIEGYECGDMLTLRIEYPTHHEFDVVTGWYDTVHNKFVIPERFPNYKRYIIKAFLVLPKFNRNERDRLGAAQV